MAIVENDRGCNNMAAARRLAVSRLEELESYMDYFIIKK